MNTWLTVLPVILRIMRPNQLVLAVNTIRTLCSILLISCSSPVDVVAIAIAIAIAVNV
jgi:hypothetical protein